MRTSPINPARPAPWLPQAQRDLAGLGLNPEWPEESLAVPGSRARRSADCALRLLAELGLRPQRLFPSLEGGVTFAFAARGRYAEVEFLDGGEVVASCSEAGQGEAHIWPVCSDLGTAFHTISEFLGD
jgi:hypothetical protein